MVSVPGGYAVVVECGQAFGDQGEGFSMALSIAQFPSAGLSVVVLALVAGFHFWCYQGMCTIFLDILDIVVLPSVSDKTDYVNLYFMVKW